MSDGKKRHAGQFLPGQSGNPGGNPKGLLAGLREKYGGDVSSLVGVLVDLGMGHTPPGYERVEVKTSDRIKAASEALDRIVGKAPQTIDGAIDIGASPDQLALLAALRMTPEERRRRMAEIDAEDLAELAEPDAGD